MGNGELMSRIADVDAVESVFMASTFVSVPELHAVKMARERMKQTFFILLF
jgi:hypothetical protein